MWSRATHERNSVSSWAASNVFKGTSPRKRARTGLRTPALPRLVTAQPVKPAVVYGTTGRALGFCGKPVNPRSFFERRPVEPLQKHEQVEPGLRAHGAATGRKSWRLLFSKLLLLSLASFFIVFFWLRFSGSFFVSSCITIVVVPVIHCCGCFRYYYSSCLALS